MTPQRRHGDAAHDLLWWLKRIAAACAALATIVLFLHSARTFAYGQISAPIVARLDRLAERDSLRYETEKSERMYGDAAVSEKLDIVIRLLTKRNH